MISQRRLPSIYTDPLSMDFQLHAQSNKSILSFLSAFQPLFSCRTSLPNKQDCPYSRQYLIYDQSLCTTCPVLAYYYLLIWHITLLDFSVAHCPALISQKTYVCVKEAYRNSATNMKVSIPFLYDINLIVPNLAPLPSFVRLYQKAGVARCTMSI